MTKTAEMTTKDFAAEIGTDPKTLRKYLRSVTPRDEQPGKGSRWVLPGTKTAINAHRKSFAKWQKEQADAAAERAAKAAKDAQDALDETEDIDEDSLETDQDEVTETED
jgi:predicted transcriptional regulator